MYVIDIDIDRYRYNIHIRHEAIAGGGDKTKKAVARQVLETVYISIFIY